MESIIIILVVYLICGILASMIHIKNMIWWDSVEYGILGFVFLIGPLSLSIYGILYLLKQLGVFLFWVKCLLDDWWFAK